METGRFEFRPDKPKRLRNRNRLSAHYSRNMQQQQQQQQAPQSRPSSPSMSSNASYLNYNDDKHRKPMQLNVQNCSSWLATCQLSDYKQNLSSYIDKYNHINLVMNLKSNTRANT